MSMIVQRIHTDHGSHIEPPFNPHWTNLQKLQWQAAVISADSGLPVTVDLSDTRRKTLFGWRRIPGRYAVHVDGTGISPLTFDSAWDYMNGVLAGAEAARR
jgi:hypothetical protein